MGSETGMAGSAMTAAEPKSLRWAGSPGGRRGECTGWTGVVGAFVCGLTPLGATTGTREREGRELQTQLMLETGFGPWFEYWGGPG